jgi:hypothetical protein
VCTEAFDDETLTSNAANDGCVPNENLLSKSLVEVMFSRGVALIGTFAIAAVFMAFAALMQVFREKPESKLAQLTRLQAGFKSYLPGFTFGSEIFLIIGMMGDAPGLASTMLVFRLLHLLGGIFLSLILYGPESIAALADHLLAKASEMKDEVDGEFCGEYPPMVGVSIILSLCDVTMVSFMPMRKSAFFLKSKGFSTMPMMQFCLVLKTAQSVVSVVCQIAYLSSKSDDLNSPTTSNQARALFIMSILTSSMGAVMGVILLGLKQKFVHDAVERRQSARQSTETDDLDMGDVYSNNSATEGDVELMANPMHHTTAGGEAPPAGPLASTHAQRDPALPGPTLAAGAEGGAEAVRAMRLELTEMKGQLDERDRTIAAMHLKIEECGLEAAGDGCV